MLVHAGGKRRAPRGKTNAPAKGTGASVISRENDGLRGQGQRTLEVHRQVRGGNRGLCGPPRLPSTSACPGVERVAAALIGPLLLRRVATHERTHEHRVRPAADLVIVG